MDFVSNSEQQIKEMLKVIGVDDVEALFDAIPKRLLMSAPTEDDGLSESEGMTLMEELAAKNSAANFDCYLGAGAYEHHVPALVSAICQRSEFLTAYTPYQAEISQGMLQAIFEFQSAICSLTGMDAANASVYDGASACAEGVLMALRQRRKARKVLIAGGVNPHYRAVVDQYLKYQDVELITLATNEQGQLDMESAMSQLDDDTAALLVQSPNFFGVVEELKDLFSLAKEKGVISILCANPLAYGLFASAGELGADIAVGDTQPFGLGLQFGGPYVGYVGCRKELIRQIPGRVVGETVDSEGKRGFVLTLQPREQHIRREKATSNICSNQALAALASLVTILWYGKEGVQKLALTNYQRAEFLKKELNEISGFSVVGNAATFNEFVVRCERPVQEVLKSFQDENILGGVALKGFHEEWSDCILVAVTETKSRKQMNRYVNVAKEVGRECANHL